MEVARERIPHVSASWRSQLSTRFLEIAHFCTRHMSLDQTPPHLITFVRVLQELTSTAVTEEHSTLSEAIPILLDVISKMKNEDTVVENSMSLLEKLMYVHFH